MSSWNWLDFFIFMFFLVNVMLGMSRGATKEVMSTMSLSAALIFTIVFTIPMAEFIDSSPLIQDVLKSKFTQNFMTAIGAGPLTIVTLRELAYSLSVLVCFVGAFSVCEAIFFFTGFVEVFSFSTGYWNRKLGAILGCTRGYIFVLIILLIFTHLFNKNNTNDQQDEYSPLTHSFFAHLFEGSVARLGYIIGERNPDKFRDIYRDKNLFNTQDVQRTVRP